MNTKRTITGGGLQLTEKSRRRVLDAFDTAMRLRRRRDAAILLEVITVLGGIGGVSNFPVGIPEPPAKAKNPHPSFRGQGGRE